MLKYCLGMVIALPFLACAGNGTSLSGDAGAGDGAQGNDTGVPTQQRDAAPDDGGKADGGTCSYPPSANDPGCPAHYDLSACSHPCTTPGLTCAYPGAGDGQSSGCLATAMMWCKVPVGQDAGADGGGTSWTCAQ